MGIEADQEQSYLIAFGIGGAAAQAFFFYLWLCVVSYFQLLREIDQISILHKVDSPAHKVTPFLVEEDKFDKENPYDNLSQHTAHSAVDTASIRSRSSLHKPAEPKATEDPMFKATA